MTAHLHISVSAAQQVWVRGGGLVLSSTFRCTFSCSTEKKNILSVVRLSACLGHLYACLF